MWPRNCCHTPNSRAALTMIHTGQGHSHLKADLSILGVGLMTSGVMKGLVIKSSLNTQEAIQIIKANYRRLNADKQVSQKTTMCTSTTNYNLQWLDKLKHLLPTTLLSNYTDYCWKLHWTAAGHSMKTKQKPTRLQDKNMLNNVNKMLSGSRIFLRVP